MWDFPSSTTTLNMILFKRCLYFSPICYWLLLGEWRCDWRSGLNHQGVCSGQVLCSQKLESCIWEAKLTPYIMDERDLILRRSSEDLTPLGWSYVCTPHTRNKASGVEIAGCARKRKKRSSGRKQLCCKIVWFPINSDSCCGRQSCWDVLGWVMWVAADPAHLLWRRFFALIW